MLEGLCNETYCAKWSRKRHRIKTQILLEQIALCMKFQNMHFIEKENIGLILHWLVPSWSFTLASVVSNTTTWNATRQTEVSGSLAGVTASGYCSLFVLVHVRSDRPQSWFLMSYIKIFINDERKKVDIFWWSMAITYVSAINRKLSPEISSYFYIQRVKYLITVVL